LNDVSLVFVERRQHPAPLPGFLLRETAPDVRRGATNDCGFRRYDHLTFNFQTMAPATLWLERVLGFQPFWKIQFHTGGEKADRGSGSGLRSVVMWDERSNIKFALNEPVIPNFEASQIYRFCEEQRGNGVQHAALALDDIVDAVGLLRKRGVRFMSTPSAYYRALPGRLDEMGLGAIPEDLPKLEELEILVDGEGSIGYLLQIFLDPSQPGESSSRRSPFFFELIQRNGDSRFGEGNFRALFESIESAQAPQLKTGTGG
ncbi:MAG TPA: VOC family protein, partial [Polyangiaceae bacterium]|nr:VOC family protein [Polyangiaceae bacterium]